MPFLPHLANTSLKERNTETSIDGTSVHVAYNEKHIRTTTKQVSKVTQYHSHTNRKITWFWFGQDRHDSDTNL